MLSPQLILGLADELVVDLFAGAGGASCGIEQALGRHVDIAVNHDRLAVAQHVANHPQTEHFCENVFAVDPLVVTKGRRIGLLWASPDCKHFSKAKGRKPVDKKIRGLANVVIDWAKAWPLEQRPRLICLENVEEFQDWGPLLRNGLPCPKRKGLEFRRWVRELKGLGYAVEWRELRACDYGAPTLRKRLFLIARCDGQPIVWPAATHAQKPAKGSFLLPWRTAAECIDWSIDVPSIFGRKKDLVPATLRRIAHGVHRYVLDCAKPFIVPITHRGDDRVHSVDEPLRTMTTSKRGEFALCVPTLIQTGYGERPGQKPRVPGLDKPLGTLVDGQKHALVAAFLAKHYGGEPQAGKTSADLRHPAPTVMARDHSAVVTGNLVKLRGTSNSASLEQPLGTITAGGSHHALVAAFLVRYFGTDQAPEMNEPLATLTTKHRDAVVTVKIEGEQHVLTDLGMRMLQPPELYLCQGFPPEYVIDHGIDHITGERVELTKEQQIKGVGNSVSPVLSRAIVLANYVEPGAVRLVA